MEVKCLYPFQQSIKQYVNDKAWLEHCINQCLCRIDTRSYIVTLQVKNSIKNLNFLIIVGIIQELGAQPKGETQVSEGLRIPRDETGTGRKVVVKRHLLTMVHKRKGYFFSQHRCSADLRGARGVPFIGPRLYYLNVLGKCVT